MLRITLPVLAFFGLILALLAGCVSVSEEECLQGDWYALGQSDGTAGHASSRLQRHQEACQRVGAVIDVAAYSAGRAEGLKFYCTVLVGYRKTLEGRSYQGVCPADLEPKFITGQLIAQPVVAARDHIKQLERELKASNEEIAEANRSLSNALTGIAGLAANDEIGRSGYQSTIDREQERIRQNTAKVERLTLALPAARLAYERAQSRARFELALPANNR